VRPSPPSYSCTAKFPIAARILSTRRPRRHREALRRKIPARCITIAQPQAMCRACRDRLRKHSTADSSPCVPHRRANLVNAAASPSSRSAPQGNLRSTHNTHRLTRSTLHHSSFILHPSSLILHPSPPFYDTIGRLNLP
jgi:hypothetical protein